MAVLSIIQKNDLQRFGRLDPEYYQPENLVKYDKLKKLNALRLGTYAKVKDGIHASIDYDPDSGINCLSAQSVKRGFIDIFASEFISKDQHLKNPKTQLQEEDIILSSVGTIGNCSIVTKDILPSNADRHVGIIQILDELDPYFVSAFLNSKYGKFQSIRESTGDVQLNLFIDKMTELLVPKLSIQNEVGLHVKKAIEKFFEAKNIMKETIKFCLSEMNLQNIRLRNDISFIKNIEDVKKANRFDGEYFHPKYDELLSLIYKFKPVPLSSLGIQIRDKAKLRDGIEYQYIEISDVDISLGEIDFTVRKTQELPDGEKIIVTNGDLLISKVRPTRCAIGIISLESDKNTICSPAFSIYRLAPPIREYVHVILRSFIGTEQLRKPIKGTSYPSIEDEDIAKIMIPRLPEPTMQQISENVTKAFEIRKEARHIIDKSIKSIDVAIDYSEKQALEILNT